MILTYFLAGLGCWAITLLLIHLDHEMPLPVLAIQFCMVASSWGGAIFWVLAVYSGASEVLSWYVSVL